MALASDVLQKASYSDEGNDQPWLDPAVPVVIEALERHIRRAADSPIADSPRLVRYMFTYRHLRGVEAVQQLNWELLETSPHWEVSDLLASLVSIGTASDGRGSWDSMGEFQAGDVEALLGVDRVLEALPDPIGEPTADFHSGFDRRRAGVAFTDRRSYALGVMEKIRAERVNSQAESPPQDGLEAAVE